MFCPQCGNTSVVLGLACAGCGTVVPEGANAPTPTAQAKPASQASTEAVDEAEFYEAAIGMGGGLDYYLSRFQWYDAQASVRSGWHWPAFFFTLWWMLYRKMWRSALVYFLAPYALGLLVVAAIMLLGRTAGGVLSGLAAVLYLGWAFLWIPSHATGMYYRHCQAKIAESKRASRNEQKQLRILAAKGGTSGLILVLLMLFAVLPVIGILAAVAIPQYAEYTARAQMKGVQGYASVAKEAIAEQYYATHRVPTTLEETGLTQPPPAMVGQVSIGKGGVLTLTMAGKVIAGKSLIYVPALDDNQRIVWECRSDDIPQRYLPPECRKAK